MQIRNVVTNDIFACHAIEAACFSLSEAATREKIEKRARIFPEGFLVAEIDEIIVGFINSGASDEDDLSNEELKDLIGHTPDGRNLIVFSIAVHPDFQGKGVSRPLLTEFINRAKELEKEQVLLLCKEHLIDYYAKFGFDDDGESKSTHGGYKWHQMRLIL